MELTNEEVMHLAELSRLALSDEEREKMHHDLSQILHYIDRLQKVDTAGVLEQTGAETTTLRSDMALPVDAAARELILSNFPERTGDALSVPAVFEKPKGS